MAFNPFNWLMGLFSLDISIDLGTRSTLISLRDKGIVINEPSVVAIKKGSNTVLGDGNAVGSIANDAMPLASVRP